MLLILKKEKKRCKELVTWHKSNGKTGKRTQVYWQKIYCFLVYLFFPRLCYGTICKIISLIFYSIIYSREKRQVILPRNNVTPHCFILPSLEKRQSQKQMYRISYRVILVISQCSILYSILSIVTISLGI